MEIKIDLEENKTPFIPHEISHKTNSQNKSLIG
jgi:hypothetical protein